MRLSAALDPCGNRTDGCTLSESLCVDCENGGRQWPCLQATFHEMQESKTTSQMTSTETVSTTNSISQTYPGSVEAATTYVTKVSSNSSRQTEAPSQPDACSNPQGNIFLAPLLTGIGLIAVQAVIVAILMSKGIVKFTCCPFSRAGVPNANKTEGVQVKESSLQLQALHDNKTQQTPP